MFNDFYLIQLMIIYSTLFLFNKIPNFCARRQNFIQLVRFLFNNFRCPIGQRISKVTLKSKMAAMIAANMEVTWKNVLSSIDNLLMETEIQDNNSDFRVPRSDISPQQTRNGGICPACNS